MVHLGASRSGPWIGLAWVALRARRLVLHRRDKVVVVMRLSFFLFFFFLKREDVPSPWSTTCFPLP
jgi:hypothetical protein